MAHPGWRWIVPGLPSPRLLEDGRFRCPERLAEPPLSRDLHLDLAAAVAVAPRSGPASWLRSTRPDRRLDLGRRPRRPRGDPTIDSAGAIATPDRAWRRVAEKPHGSDPGSCPDRCRGIDPSALLADNAAVLTRGERLRSRKNFWTKCPGRWIFDDLPCYLDRIASGSTLLRKPDRPENPQRRPEPGAENGPWPRRVRGRPGDHSTSQDRVNHGRGCVTECR